MLPVILYTSITPQTMYILTSVCIGILGRKRLIGFWGFLIISLFLTPAIGLLLLAITEYASPTD